MNNSDLISALSLAITAIIFLVQTDDGLLQLKLRAGERWVVGGFLLTIVFLINHAIFERAGLSFYFRLKGFYLKPEEWALLVFLYLLGVTLYRIFTPTIFNRNPATILALIQRYRAEKKWNKLQNLLLRVLELDDFEQHYARELDDTIFNDHHLIEYFASDYPELLIQFSKRYPKASIANGEHFFYVLNGLFADKSNPIFSEIRQYQQEEDKCAFLEEFYELRYDGQFEFDPQKDYKTKLPIVSYLANIIGSHPSNLKEETLYFFRQFPETASSKNNRESFTETEMERLLSRDRVYNLIRLFRILLVEYCFTNKNANVLIDRVLTLLYGAWEHVEKSTRLENPKVALNNDEYTINEYYLKYLFYSYLSLSFLLEYTRPFRIGKEDERNDSTAWPMQQLFAKLDSLWGHEGIVSQESKKYYMEKLFQIYFELPKYIKDGDQLNKVSKSLLWYIKDSLDASPYGDVQMIRRTFHEACGSFDFLEYNTWITLGRAQLFKMSLIPHSSPHEWKIMQSVPG